MKTCSGIETYGCFSMGQDGQFAQELFGSLDGTEQVSPEAVMTIDLVKRQKGVLYPLALKHCSLEQLGENVKRISKELFIYLNLKH